MNLLLTTLLLLKHTSFIETNVNRIKEELFMVFHFCTYCHILACCLCQWLCLSVENRLKFSGLVIDSPDIYQTLESHVNNVYNLGLIYIPFVNSKRLIKTQLILIRILAKNEVAKRNPSHYTTFNDGLLSKQMIVKLKNNYNTNLHN